MVAELGLKDPTLGWMNYDEYYSIRSGYRELRDVLLDWIIRYKVERVWWRPTRALGQWLSKKFFQMLEFQSRT